MENQNLNLIKQNYCDVHSQSMINASKFLAGRGVQFDYDWTMRQTELFHIDRFNYLHTKSINAGLTPIFITLTLPSSYHQFKQSTNGHIVNPKWDGTTVTDSYKKLVSIFREVYNGFTIRSGNKVVHQKVVYSRVIEPHKDFTPHLHAVVYVEDSVAFKRHFDNVVDSNELEQVDFETLDSASYSIAYLLKYVSKSISGDDSYIEGWKRVHKIVMVRTSNLPFTKIEYLEFKKNVPFNKVYSTFYAQMDVELMAVRHTIKYDYAINYAYRNRMDFLSDNLTDFKKVVVGNSVNPKYIFHSYSANCHNIVDGDEDSQDYIEVEFSDSTSNYLVTQNMVHFDDFWMTEEDLCLDEEYNGCPIPFTYDYYVFEDDNEEYSYLELINRRSNLVLYKQFEEV